MYAKALYPNATELPFILAKLGCNITLADVPEKPAEPAETVYVPVGSVLEVPCDIAKLVSDEPPCNHQVEEPESQVRV